MLGTCVWAQVGLYVAAARATVQRKASRRRCAAQKQTRSASKRRDSTHAAQAPPPPGAALPLPERMLMPWSCGPSASAPLACAAAPLRLRAGGGRRKGGHVTGCVGKLEAGSRPGGELALLHAAFPRCKQPRPSTGAACTHPSELRQRRYRTASLSYDTGWHQVSPPRSSRSCCPTTSTKSSPSTCS